MREFKEIHYISFASPSLDLRKAREVRESLLRRYKRNPLFADLHAKKWEVLSIMCPVLPISISAYDIVKKQDKGRFRITSNYVATSKAYLEAFGEVIIKLGDTAANSQMGWSMIIKEEGDKVDFLGVLIGYEECHARDGKPGYHIRLCPGLYTSQGIHVEADLYKCLLDMFGLGSRIQLIPRLETLYDVVKDDELHINNCHPVRKTMRKGQLKIINIAPIETLVHWQCLLLDKYDRIFNGLFLQVEAYEERWPVVRDIISPEGLTWEMDLYSRVNEKWYIDDSDALLSPDAPDWVPLLRWMETDDAILYQVTLRKANEKLFLEVVSSNTDTGAVIQKFGKECGIKLVEHTLKA